MAMLSADTPFAGLDYTIAPGPRTDTLGMFGAAWRESRLLEQSNSGTMARREALDDLETATGASSAFYQGARNVVEGLPIAGQQLQILEGLSAGAADPDMYARLPAVLARVAKARETDAHAYPGLPATREDFDKFVAERVQREAADLGATLARPADGEFGGAFLGGMTASFTDPVNQLLLPFGAADGANVLRTVATESALGAASVAAAAPSVALWRNQVGLDYTAQDFFGNLATAAAAGGLFGGGLKLAGHVITKLAPIGKMTPGELVEHTRGLAMTPDQRAASDLVQNAVDTLGSNPLADTPAGREEHVVRLQEAVDAVVSGRPSTQGEPLTPVLDHEAFAGSADRQVRKAAARLRDVVAEISTARERLSTIDTLGEQAAATPRKDTIASYFKDGTDNKPIHVAVDPAGNVVDWIVGPKGTLERRTKRDIAGATIVKLTQKDFLAAGGDTAGALRAAGAPDLQVVRDGAARDLERALAKADKAGKRLAAMKALAMASEPVPAHAPAQASVVDHALRALRRGGDPAALNTLQRIAQGPLAQDLLDAVGRAAKGGDARVEGEAFAARAADMAKRMPELAPAPRVVRDEGAAPRSKDGGTQSSSQARLESFTEPGKGGSEAQAAQLRRDLEEDVARGRDIAIPTNPENGAAESAANLLEEFKRDDDAIAHLEGCIAGGLA